MAKGAAVGGLFGGGENQTQPGIITAKWHEIDMDNLSYNENIYHYYLSFYILYG